MFKNIFSLKKNSKKLQLSDYVFLITGLIVFATIAFINITKSSIWFDEAFGAYLIKFNFIEIARYTATDVHPPLYYWLLKIWSMFFGNTELALRSMSVFFGGFAIVLGYLLTRKLFNKNVARFGLLFMVISPMLIRYSQEARMYTLVATIALGATYALTFAVESKKKMPWTVYGVLVGLGMWTHYFSAIVWIAHWIWRADAVKKIAGKGKFLRLFFSKEWVRAHIVALLVFVPWMPMFIIQIFTVQAFGFWIPPVTPNTPINFLTNAFFYLDVNEVTGWLALGFILAVVFVGTLSFKVCDTLEASQRRSYRLIAALSFAPVVVLFLISMPPLRSAFIDRYLITSAIAMAMFIGITFALGAKFVSRRLRIIVMVLIACFMLIGINSVWRLGNYNKNMHNSNNTRQIIEAVENRSGNGQPIIAVTPWLFYEAVFYSTDNHPVYFIDQKEYKYGSLDMLKYNNQHKIKDINAFTKEHPTIWYVGYIADGDFGALYPNWEPIQEVWVNDSVSNKKSYKAIQFRIAN